MRTLTLAALVFIGSTAPTFAQPATQPATPVSQEEVNKAMDRLEQRRAARAVDAPTAKSTTAPMTRDVGTIPQDPAAMRDEILRLRRQLTALRQQNNDMMGQLVTLQPTRTDLLQLQQQAKLDAERERSENERLDAAYDRGRLTDDRGRDDHDPRYDGYNRNGNRDVILVQPNPDKLPAPTNPAPTPAPQPAPAPSPVKKGDAGGEMKGGPVRAGETKNK